MGGKVFIFPLAGSYQIPNSIVIASDLSDDDNQSQSSLTDSGRVRRQLPTPPTEQATPVNDAELRRCFSMERKDIEDAFKLEIVQLEDTHMREKNDMLKGFKREKVGGSGIHVSLFETTWCARMCRMH